MIKITIKSTQNPAILKFEFPDFITQNESFEFKNIDEAKASPLAQQLFYLPFVKTVYILCFFGLSFFFYETILIESRKCVKMRQRFTKTKILFESELVMT